MQFFRSETGKRRHQNVLIVIEQFFHELGYGYYRALLPRSKSSRKGLLHRLARSSAAPLAV